MLKKSMWSIAAFGLLLFFAAGTAIAQNTDPSTETVTKQRQELQRIYDKYDTATNDTHQSLLVKKAELNAAMNSSSPNNELVQKLSKEIGELQGKLRAARMDMQTELQQAGLTNDYFCDEMRHRNHIAGDCWYGYDTHNDRCRSSMTGHRFGNSHRKHMRGHSWDRDRSEESYQNDSSFHRSQRGKFRHNSDGNRHRSHRY